MSSLRFVHAADLHLDAPFRGLSLDSAETGDKLRQATFIALQNLVDLCLRVRADFLLVAGDVYNQKDRSLRAQLRFRDALARLADHNVDAYVVHGNHDPTGTLSRAVRWPENTRVFESQEPECAAYVREEETLALIHGASHTRGGETRNLARKFRRSPEDVFQIGLLHANLGGNTGHEPYAPCDLQDLRAGGMDYWALGHVHSGGVRSRDPWAVYPGNIQGLSIAEPGSRGCYVVDVGRDRSVEAAFHPLHAVQWAVLEVDLRDLDTLDRLEEGVLEAVEAERERAGNCGLICRVVLCGRGPLHLRVSEEEGREELVQRLREQFSAAEPFVWIKDLVAESAPEIDLEARRGQKDLLGEVLAQAEELRNREDLLEFLHKEVLSDLFGHRRAKRFLQGLSREEADELLRRAELLCADRLESSDGE